MEEMLEFIIIAIGLIAAISKAASKKKAEKEPPIPTVKAGHPYTAPKTMPAPAPVKPASMATMLPPRQPAPAASPAAIPLQPNTPAFVPAQVSLHEHLEASCDAHDAPSGSLNVVSPEGKDPCHEEQMQPRTAFPETEENDVSLDLDWSADGMVKAFIMQEVLTRPAKRRMAR